MSEKSVPLIVLPHDAELKFKILRAIDEPIEKITVTKICEKCEISKRTFYNHFDSKYSILPWYLSIARHSIGMQIGRTISLESGLLAIYQFLANEKQFVYYAGNFIIYPKKDSALSWNTWSSMYLAVILEKYPNVDKKKIEDLLFGYLSLETAFLIRWIESELNEPFAAVVENIMRFVPDELQELLRHR